MNYCKNLVIRWNEGYATESGWVWEGTKESLPGYGGTVNVKWINQEPEGHTGA